MRDNVLKINLKKNKPGCHQCYVDTVFDLLMFLIYVTTKHSQRNKNSKLLNIVFSLKSEASNSKPLLDVGIFKKKDKLKMTVEHELNLSSVKMQFHGV